MKKIQNDQIGHMFAIAAKVRLAVVMRGLLYAFCAACVLAVPTTSTAQSATQLPTRSAAIGEEGLIGSVSQIGSRQILHGAGLGPGLGPNGADSLCFSYIERDAGDFEVAVEITDLPRGEDSCFGVMARASNAATAPMAAVYYRTKNNIVNWMSRLPATGGRSRTLTGGIELAKKAAPLWLKLVRIGANFAAYKSRDGQLWLPLGNESGGPVALNGPLELGLFIASGSSKQAEAAFSRFYAGPDRMKWRTSWVGNSFGSRSEDNHVSNGLSAMWTASDGTCYTSSYWDEGGQPVTSYRNGRVWRALPIGTPQTYQGAITGDAKYVFVAAVDRIVRLDPLMSDFGRFDFVFTENLLDKKSNHSVVSGMASNGSELFISDSRTNKIRVAAVETIPTYHIAQAANDDIAVAPAPVVVPTGPGYAQAAVYRTQRSGEGNRYALPGFVPGEAYTLRLHLAEFVDRPANADPRNRIFYYSAGGRNLAEVNVAKEAGGVLRAMFLDIPECKADAKGEISFSEGSYGGPGLCGIEVLDHAGRRRLAINCGGEPLKDAQGDWKGESQEQPERGFPFERPGPMVFDRRGDLWIIRRSEDIPLHAWARGKYPAAVICVHPDGRPTGREIIDVVNPGALAYDAAHDRLLVGENGLDMNVRVFGGLASRPVLVRTFGQKGGLLGGRQPGLVRDPQAGGDARFAGIAGLGVDRAGNLYVGGGQQGTDLRAFRPDGKLAWEVHSLMFCCTYDVDPASDGAELYGTYNHLHMDLGRTASGRLETYMGYNWDLRRFGEPDRPSNSQAILRRLGKENRLFMFTTAQGNVGEVKIFRYDGEIAVPAGGVMEKDHSRFWCDLNGDGKVQPDEVVKMASPLDPTGFTVDSKGDMWVVVTSTSGSFLRHFRFKGVNAKGVPIYTGGKGPDCKDVPLPEEGEKTNGWGMASRVDYDADHDILIAFMPKVARAGENDRSPAQYVLARYDGWSKGNRKSTWKVPMLRPETDPDYFMYETNQFPYSGYMGMQICGDYIFFAYLYGEVHVFDLKTGILAEVISPGPEVNGQTAWEDATMGLRAFRRKNGEYLIFTENSGWGGKDNLYRWRP